MILSTVDLKSRVFKWFVAYFNYFVILFIVLLVALSYVFYFGPQKEKVEKIKNYNIAREEKYYHQNKRYLAYLKKQEKKYEAISKENKQRIQVMLPDRSDFPEIFAQFKRIIVGNGYTLQQINLGLIKITKNNFSKKEEKVFPLEPYIGKIHVDLIIKGVKNYTDYKRLLSLLENNLRLIDLDGIDYNPNNHTIELTGIIYYYKPVNKLTNS